MKIVQNPENGQILIHLKNDEVYDIEQHLDALMQFVSEQAVITFKLKSSYSKILKRLDELEQKQKG